MLKRLIGLNAGRFRLLIQLDEILHDAQRFVPDRIGLRGRLLASASSSSASTGILSCFRSKATGRNFGADRSSRVSS